jgi:spore maturation protein SpmB
MRHLDDIRITFRVFPKCLLVFCLIQNLNHTSLYEMAISRLHERIDLLDIDVEAPQTRIFQPMDIGVISSFKAQYHK